MLQVIATATIAAYVGLGGLGRFIIDGLAQRDYPQMIGGSLLVALLAIVVDLLLGGAPEGRRLARPAGRPAQRPAPAARGAHRPVPPPPVRPEPVAPRAGGTDHETLPDRPCPGHRGRRAPRPHRLRGWRQPADERLRQSGGGGGVVADTIVVGSANFTENQILAEIYAQALQAKGVKVTKKLNIGSREAYFPGLQDGSIDLIPEYTGVLLQYFNKSATETEPDAVYAALQKALPGTLTVLDKSSAEDKDAVVVTKETATKYNAKSIADLAANCGQLTFGGPPEFKTRPDGIPGLQKTYNCTFKEFKALDAGGPLTVAALKNGEVQAADIFTTDPSIAANDFVVLRTRRTTSPRRTSCR